MSFNLLRRMVVPGKSIPVERSEDSDDTDTALIGDNGESSSSILSSDSGMPASPAHTRSNGKAI